MAGDITGVLSNYPAQGIVALTSGTLNATGAGRAVFIDCTASGNLTLQFVDGSTKVINVQLNTLYQFNWAINKFTSGTATATVAILI
jgi:hypothetical protein